MPRASVALFALLTLAPCGGAAQSEQTYFGAHPLDHAGHWHRVEGEHTHEGLVIGDAPFGEAGDRRIFLGDPLSWGWEGDVFAYRNAHPIPGADAYCSIEHAHAHTFAPEGSYRRDDDGGYTYVGGLRGGRPMLRPERLAPERPIARPVAGPPPAMVPFWYAGCLQIWNPRAPGGAAALPLYGCHPRAAFIAGSFYGGAAGPPASRAPSAPSTSTTTFRPQFRSRPGRLPSGSRRSGQ